MIEQLLDTVTNTGRHVLKYAPYVGWSHFAQFTIAVVNKDPKKSKYSGMLFVPVTVGCACYTVALWSSQAGRCWGGVQPEYLDNLYHPGLAQSRKPCNMPAMHVPCKRKPTASATLPLRTECSFAAVLLKTWMVNQ